MSWPALVRLFAVYKQAVSISARVDDWIGREPLCSFLMHAPPLPSLLPSRVAPLCRGRWAEGKAVLRLLRGTTEVDAEYADIADAAQQAAKVSLMQVSAGVCASV